MNAARLAWDLGYSLEIDGPSDEELEQLTRVDEPGDDEVPFWADRPLTRGRPSRCMDR